MEIENNKPVSGILINRLFCTLTKGRTIALFLKNEASTAAK